MNVLEWYAVASACFGTPVAVVMMVAAQTERGSWPAWTNTAALWTAGFCWLLGMAFVLNAS